MAGGGVVKSKGSNHRVFEDAIAEFHDLVESLDNLPSEERDLRIAGGLLPLLSRLYPGLKNAGRLDGIFRILATEFDSATTDVHGGNDAGLQREALNIHLAAISEVLSRKTGVSARKARDTVSRWSGGSPRPGTIENWGYKGKALAVADRPDRSSAFEATVQKIETEVSRIHRNEVEELLRVRVEQLLKRVGE